MAPERFDPTSLRTDDVMDADGRPIGRLLASRFDPDGQHVAAVIVGLNDDVRRERLVDADRLQVAAAAVRVENGKPRLTLTLDELLHDQGVSHHHGPGAPAGKPERRPDHFGAPADPDKAPDSDRR